MSKVINDDELNKLLGEVQVEIDAILKSEKDNLAKAHPGEATESEVEPDESATAPAADDSASSAATSAPPADASASPDASTAPVADASGTPPADASGDPAADGSAPADGSDGGDPAADASTNPEELVPHYAKLPLEALKAHYLAAKMALAAMMGSAGATSDPSAAAPAPDASVAAPPAPDASAAPALKGELKDVPSNGGDPLNPTKGTSVAKSEDVLALETELAETKLAMATLVKSVTKIVEAPVRKAVTAMADVEAPTAVDVSKLTKAEIDKKIRRASETNLSKSDRDLITSFALGNVKVDGIAHLLK